MALEVDVDLLALDRSAAFLDDFWSELCKLSAIKSDEQFRSGLYLGSQLILALSQPPARIPRP